MVYVIIWYSIKTDLKSKKRALLNVDMSVLNGNGFVHMKIISYNTINISQHMFVLLYSQLPPNLLPFLTPNPPTPQEKKNIASITEIFM